ncbi:MAG: hypothetical protein KAX80_04770, partial [Planctomycetes bacterium]|nr:hypothetical protein [Planctomycetota bacterium]
MASHDFPSLEDIYSACEEFVTKHAPLARLETLGSSPEGRPVQAVFVTEPSVPPSEKEVALFVCGRHGNELGTRVVGLALLEWLASEAGAETRRKQLVVVVPVANPDGCVREEFFAPDDGLSETEQATIAQLASSLRPDAVLDVHSMSAGDTEAVITAHTTAAGEDEFVHRAVGVRMVEGAARAGYPFALHRVHLSDGYNNFFCGMCYERLHSLAFGMETNHFALTPEESAESAVAAITPLLRTGNQRAPWQCSPGYPNRIIVGELRSSIQATGTCPEEVRESRCRLWAARRHFAWPRREMPNPHTLQLSTDYTGEEEGFAFSLCCRLRGEPDVRNVSLNGA